MDDCIEFQGARDRRGYGRRMIGGRRRFAHRAAWFEAHGAWPKGVLMHTCDNPGCVNLAHLRDATQKDNIQDVFLKDRPFGRKKLNHQQVRDIRNQLFEGCRQTDLAKFYDLAPSSISHIASGTCWSLV